MSSHLMLFISFSFFIISLEANAEKASAGEVKKFMTADWVDLLPKSDLDALSKPPKYLDDIKEKSVEDQITAQLGNQKKPSSDDPYHRALVSTKVVKALDGLPIRIPGFIVPLEFDDNLKITQFFLVPWFGACIHYPPPPPNQIIFVNYSHGFQLKDLVDPFWISGVLKTNLIKNDMATAAYSMEMHAFEIYKED